MEKKYKVGIVPGSFDPITKGHVDIVARATALCDKVYLAVMINADKRYMFTLDERRMIAEAAVFGMSGVSVISSDGMLYELANELSADAIIKGVRNERDREYEETMARYNSERCAAKTVLLDADETLTAVSSTAVRECIEKSEPLEALLPDEAIKVIKKILYKKEK